MRKIEAGMLGFVRRISRRLERGDGGWGRNRRSRGQVDMHALYPALVYMFPGRYFVRGLLAGSVKG